MIKKILFLISIFFSKNAISNEIVNIKTYDRDSYIRIMFEMEEKPEYFVNQENGKINIRLPKATISSNLHKNIDKLEVIEEIFLFEEQESLTFTVLLIENASLMRYLYTAPASNTPYYRVIVDINRPIKQKIENNNSEENIVEDINNNDVLNNFLENNLYTENTVSNLTDLQSVDELIDKKVDTTKHQISSVDELIKENVKANTMDELLDLNNINEEQVVKSFEEQNNENLDLDDFLQSLSTRIANNEKREKKQEKIKQYIIVIDAGHGGKDPGAIGLMKTKEKDINLSYALFIKSELEKNRKFKVFLTRSNDNFVSLSDRVNKSRRLHADLFISIHSDSSTNRRARGLSIYTLSKSASDERTTKLMQKSLANTFNYWRNKYKYDKIRYQTLNDSVRFSNVLLKNLKRNGIKTFSNSPIKQANFAVLIAPEYPSILLELGFISNLYDEKLLKTYSYKKKISDNIIKSINEYFK